MLIETGLDETFTTQKTPRNVRDTTKKMFIMCNEFVSVYSELCTFNVKNVYGIVEPQGSSTPDNIYLKLCNIVKAFKFGINTCNT